MDERRHRKQGQRERQNIPSARRKSVDLSLDKAVQVARTGRDVTTVKRPVDYKPGGIAHRALAKTIGEREAKWRLLHERQVRSKLMKLEEDRRRWNERWIRQPYRLVDRLPVVRAFGPTAVHRRLQKIKHTKIMFEHPHYMWICAKRKIRREVLHALKLHRGHGSGTPKRRNEYSSIGC